MNFELTQDQKMIRDNVREFARSEIAPKAAEIDRTGQFPEDIVKKMADLDLMGLPFSEEYGGAGADHTSYYLALEEIARVCGSTALTYEAHICLGCMPVNLFGTREQKQKYLAPLCRGEALGSFGLTEPNAGSDAGGTQTTAVLSDGQWIINGTKCFITNASYSRFVTITAVTDRGKGLKQFLKVLDGGRIGMATGIGQACLDASLKYAESRIFFGCSMQEKYRSCMLVRKAYTFWLLDSGF